MDEIDFVLNIYNGHTLVFKWDSKLNYADVVSV